MVLLFELLPEVLEHELVAFIDFGLILDDFDGGHLFSFLVLFIDEVSEEGRELVFDERVGFGLEDIPVILEFCREVPDLGV